MPWKAQSVSETILSHISEFQATRDNNLNSPLALNGPGQLNAAVCEALAADLALAGIERGSISTGIRLDNTDGYISGSRDWDLVVYEDDVPAVLIEVQVNLSAFARNMRNRLSQIIALAASLRQTFDEPARAPFRPRLAVTLIVGSHYRNDALLGQALPPSIDDVELPVRRAGEALAKMLADGLLDAACLLMVDARGRQVLEPHLELTFDRFVGSIRERQESMVDLRTSTSTVAASLGRAFSRGRAVDDVVDGLVSTPEGFSAAEAAIIRSRRRLIEELQRLALDEGVNESAMHAAIGSNYWIFGGQYIGILERRSLLPLDQYDIPLICADGSLEIVELKGPEVSLVRVHRNHLMVTNDVHTAVSQCLNYLHSLDGLGPSLTTYYRNERGIKLDLQRAKGTVIIGHPERENPRTETRERIDQTIRSYNSHLSRLTVSTYADLLESAERALQFSTNEEDVRS